MPISSNSKKNGPKPKLSRTEHSELLKSSLKSKQEFVGVATPVGSAGSPTVPGEQTGLQIPAQPPVTFPESEVGLRIVEKSKTVVTLEQTVVYNPGKGRPIINVQLRLTTAIAGQRKQDGLAETAYLLRLEVVAAGGRAQVEGYCLGPWHAENQHWEAGSIYISQPFWASFQPQAGLLKGRIYIYDIERNRLLDLPWKTEGIFPGIKPLA